MGTGVPHFCSFELLSLESSGKSYERSATKIKDSRTVVNVLS